MTKNELRNYIKTELQNHSENFPQWSEQICRTILQSNWYNTSDTIFTYLALKDEVDLTLLIKNALNDGKTVYIPKVIPNTSTMVFNKYTAEAKTEEGYCGIQEPVIPDPEHNNNCIKNTSSIEGNILFLVPGRAFTQTGARLGRGKGFYDIFLSEFLKDKKNRVHCAGVCFPPQLVESLPVDEHDLFMDSVFTLPGNRN